MPSLASQLDATRVSPIGFPADSRLAPGYVSQRVPSLLSCVKNQEELGKILEFFLVAQERRNSQVQQLIDSPNSSIFQDNYSRASAEIQNWPFPDQKDLDSADGYLDGMQSIIESPIENIHASLGDQLFRLSVQTCACFAATQLLYHVVDDLVITSAMNIVEARMQDIEPILASESADEDLTNVHNTGAKYRYKWKKGDGGKVVEEGTLCLMDVFQTRLGGDPDVVVKLGILSDEELVKHQQRGLLDWEIGDKYRSEMLDGRDVIEMQSNGVLVVIFKEWEY